MNINAQARALLQSLARDRHNGASAQALQLAHAPATIRKLYAARLIEKYTRKYANPPGLTVIHYRITAAGQQALSVKHA